MSTTIPFRNTNPHAAQAMADRVISAVDRGVAVTIDGRPVAGRVSQSSGAASVWNNGTVSFCVRARNGRPGSRDDVFVKRGAEATIVFEEA